MPLSRLSGILSIFSSMALVYMILSNYERKLARPKNRLMLMMSFCDILASTAFAFSEVAMPLDSGRQHARGNSKTCTAQGIFIWLGLAVPMYNSSLNLFYMLTIKYNVHPKYFTEKVEPFLHLLSISIPLSAAITFAALGEIVPCGNVCFGNSPSVMITLACISSFCLLFCIFSMASICWAVKQRANRMRKYSFRSSFTNKSNMLEEIETVKQALLYTSAFILTFIFPLCQVAYLVVAGPGASSIVLIVLTGIFYPLQGFWNFVLYIRPGVNRVRERDPDKNLIRAVREVVFGVQSIVDTPHNGVSHENDSNDAESNNNVPIVATVNSGSSHLSSVLTDNSIESKTLMDHCPNNRGQSVVQFASVSSQLSSDDLSEEDHNRKIMIDERRQIRRCSLVQIASVLSPSSLDELSDSDIEI